MKPGNLQECVVPNPAATIDEDSIEAHIESFGVCKFFVKDKEKWKRDCLHPNVLPAVIPTR